MNIWCLVAFKENVLPAELLAVNLKEITKIEQPDANNFQLSTKNRQS